MTSDQIHSESVALCYVTRLLGRINVPDRYVQMPSAVSRLVYLGLVSTISAPLSTHIRSIAFSNVAIDCTSVAMK